jgi:hypothetical protein
MERTFKGSGSYYEARFGLHRQHLLHADTYGTVAGFALLMWKAIADKSWRVSCRPSVSLLGSMGLPLRRRLESSSDQRQAGTVCAASSAVRYRQRRRSRPRQRNRFCPGYVQTGRRGAIHAAIARRRYDIWLYHHYFTLLEPHS